MSKAKTMLRDTAEGTCLKKYWSETEAVVDMNKFRHGEAVQNNGRVVRNLIESLFGILAN